MVNKSPLSLKLTENVIIFILNMHLDVHCSPATEDFEHPKKEKSFVEIP